MQHIKLIIRCSSVVGKFLKIKEQWSTHTLIHHLHGEEFPVATRVAPCSDAALVGDTSADGPPAR